MGYWGWRPLVFGVFISTWVVGCNLITDNTSPSAAPSAYPDVTLTVGRLPTARVSAAATRTAPTRQRTAEPPPAADATPETYVVQAGDTLAGIATRFGVSAAALVAVNGSLSMLEAGQTVLIPPGDLLPLAVRQPTCTETRPGSLLCLGRVDNPLDFPVESVAVEVRLLHDDGSVLQSEHSSVEQPGIPAGGFAPYQAIFHVDWGDFASADARLTGAARTADDARAILLIDDVRGAISGERVVVNATLTNPGAQPAELQRAFITLTDASGGVTGYRVIRFEAGTVIAPGATMPLQLVLSPQTPAPDADLTLYVEARFVGAG